MHRQQTATMPIFTWPLEIASRIWKQAGKQIHGASKSAGEERVASRVPAHLLRDIGVIDCRVTRRAEPLTSPQTSLEANWLRSL